MSGENREAASSTSPVPTKSWWKIRLFRGMIDDLRRRGKCYESDWKDAWDYRVVPAMIYMYFAKYGSPNSISSTPADYVSFNT